MINSSIYGAIISNSKNINNLPSRDDLFAEIRKCVLDEYSFDEEIEKMDEDWLNLSFV
jgi:hypothetical protein